MICPTCGAESRPGQKFCSDCGTRLGSTCPSCGTPYESAPKFCAECGGSLNSASAPNTGRRAAAVTAPTSAKGEVPPETPVAATERRFVSVLFADLVGFTTLAQARDPEEVRELLTEYFDRARDVVARYGGTIEKFIGDAVMAVWGTPNAHEDDAERAVRAALELVEGLRELGQSVGAGGLQARAAVLSGEAAVTVGATGQGMVAGDLVNTASRLQSVAPPGAVLVGESTYRSASGAIVFEPLGEQALKGKELPVLAWQALRVVAQRGGVGRAAGLEAPFVGRDEEMRLLKELLHATARESRARLVSVVGVAGIGKSRLAWEFLKYIDGLIEGVYWHQGRSPAYGEGITFWAVGEMVRQRARIAETDDRATSRGKLAAALAEYVPDPEERRWIEPRLAHLLGLEEARAGEREELFAAWRALFERVAERGLTVLVFEDLQWADTGVLDFVEYLLEWSRSYPILIVTLARPELLERRPGWGAGQRNFVALSLEPLSDAAMAALVGGLVPGLPDGIMRQMIARAEGVPLYAVETVRMLLDEGRLAAEGGIYRLRGELSDLAVPDSLHALIGARLDALDPTDRSLLQDAAVLGQIFTVAGLSALTGEAAELLEARLRALVRKELLVFDADPRSPERGQYGFVQGLIREVAYTRLPKKNRRSRHLAAARYFESLGDEELAAVLASHYLDAYRATPEGPEADALAAQARIALRAAAERAASLHSHGQALAYFEQAAAITPDRDERAALSERAADSALAAADYERAERHVREALLGARERGDTSAIARLTVLLGRALINTSRHDAAVELLEATIGELTGDAFERAEDPAVVSLGSALAGAYVREMEAGRALEWSERALVGGERLNSPAIVVEALITKAMALGFLGRPLEQQALLRGALVLAEARDQTGQELRARFNLNEALLHDDPRSLVATVRAGLEKSQQLGLREWAHAFAMLAFAALHTGDWDWALATVADLQRPDLPTSESICFAGTRASLSAFRGSEEDRELATLEPIVRASEDPQTRHRFAIDIALVALARHRFAEANEQAIAAAAISSHADRAYALTWAARAALWARDVPRTREALQRLRSAPVHGRWIDTTRDVLDAGLAALEGRRSEATSLYETATRRLRDLDLPLDLAFCLLEFATFAAPGGREIEAALDEARALLTTLASPPLLALIEQARPVPEPETARTTRIPAVGRAERSVSHPG